MKTFEGYSIIEKSSEGDDRKLVFPMYFLRAVSVTLSLFLLFYITGRLLAMLYPIPTFPEFILENYFVVLFLIVILLLGQLLFYAYRSRAGVKIRRSTWEIIMGYALPIIGIIAAVYTAYAIAVM
ncbi:MAG: hypothetical protein NT130_04920 [Candidatus Micrarchaeota archaeon]|nr:hypothetical protein [Candidatus Micrarchaeota archaeon]